MKISNLQKKEYFSKFKNSLEKYCFLIENKTDVCIGEIGLRDFCYFPWKKMNENFFVSLINKFKAKKGVSAVYFDSNIYLPITKHNLENNIGQKIDETIVHELTHHLWWKLSNSNEFEKIPVLWTEGFATYGEFCWFKEFYPLKKHSEKNIFLPKEYLCGKMLIENLVKKYSEDILLEIPNKWKKLNKKLKDNLYFDIQMNYYSDNLDDWEI